MYLYLYNNLNGEFEGSAEVPEEIMDIPIEPHIQGFIYNYLEEEKINITGMYVEEIPRPTFEYLVIDGELMKRPNEEIAEIRKYHKLLTEEEKEQLRQQTILEQQKQVETVATESFAKMSFRMMAPTLTTTQILEFEPLVENWQKGTYIIGDIRKHLGQVWKCVQGHNNTNNPDIEPGKSAAQWSPYHSKDIKYAKPYIQPQGAHDAYMKGEYMIFEDKTYKSIIDNNVWTPTNYPQGWLVI